MGVAGEMSPSYPRGGYLAQLPKPDTVYTFRLHLSSPEFSVLCPSLFSPAVSPPRLQPTRRFSQQPVPVLPLRICSAAQMQSLCRGDDTVVVGVVVGNSGPPVSILLPPPSHFGKAQRSELVQPVCLIAFHFQGRLPAGPGQTESYNG